METRALVRSAASGAALRAGGVEIVEGNVRDAPSLARAAAGRDVVFHAPPPSPPMAAGRSTAPSTSMGRTTSRRGPRLGARLLHVSSVAVYGADDRYRGIPTDEEARFPLPSGVLRPSKRESEALVLEAHRRGEIWRRRSVRTSSMAAAIGSSHRESLASSNTGSVRFRGRPHDASDRPRRQRGDAAVRAATIDAAVDAPTTRRTTTT